VISGGLVLVAAAGCAVGSDGPVHVVGASSPGTAVARTTSSTGEVTTTTAWLEPSVVEDVGGVRELGLEVGDCFRGEMPEFDIVDCEEPHDAEVFGLDDHHAAEGAPYPGRAELSFVTDQRCVEAYASHVGESIQETEWRILIVEPSEESWDERDDRAFLCALVSTDDALVGSQQGTGTRPPAHEERTANLLVPGDCILKPERPPILAVSIVPCTEAHDFEVYAVYDAPAGEYPGDEKIERIAGERCVAEFPAYVGLSFERSRLNSVTFKPDAKTWAIDDRRFICLLMLDGQQLRSSQREAAR
jgi:hypothetical protein